MTAQTKSSDQLVPAWLPLDAWRDYTQFKALREKGKLETRGCPAKRDEAQIVGLYIELEVRCEILGISLLSFLKDIKFRVIDDGIRRLSNPAERGRLRRYHSEGQRHVEHWRGITFMHRPHPRTTGYNRQFELKKVELEQLPRGELFILNRM
jgi:hypothetical protein